MMQLGRRLLITIIAMAAIALPAAGRAAGNDFSIAMRELLLTDPARALSAAESALARTGAQQPWARSRQLWVQAQAQFRTGDVAGAEASLREMASLRLTGRADTLRKAEIALLRAMIAWQADDPGQALPLLRQAQRHAITARAVRVESQALQLLGVLYNDASDSTNAIRYLELAGEVYHGDDAYNFSLENNTGVALTFADRFSDAAIRFERANRIARRLNANAMILLTQGNLAFARAEAGQIDAAARTIAQIPATQFPTSGSNFREIRRASAIIAMRRGRLPEARRHIEEALADLGDAEPSTQTRRLRHTAYQIYLASGDRARALAMLQQLWDGSEVAARKMASNRAALLSAQFQFATQNARIDRMKAQQLARDVAYERQRNRLQLIMGIVITVSALIALALLAGLLRTALRARNRARADGQQLAAINADLGKALAAKEEFLAATSHEMRTPLNGILGMTQVLLADERVSGETRDQIGLVHSAGSAMRALVDDLLDIAQNERGTFAVEPRPTPIGDIAREVTEQFRREAEQAGIAVRYVNHLGDVTLMLDPDRVRQILVNLVGNARKFTERGSIDVEVAAVPGSTEQIAISVTDSGIGIDPKWHDAIFEPFRQVDGTRARRFGGTGLGLAICRKLARAMGGEIRVESTMGTGSRFILTLPMIVSEPAQPELPAAGVTVIGNDPLRTALLANMVKAAAGAAIDISNAASAADRDRLTGHQWQPADLIVADGLLARDHDALFKKISASPAQLILAGSADPSAAAEDKSLITQQSVPMAAGPVAAAVAAALVKAQKGASVYHLQDPQQPVMAGAVPPATAMSNLRRSSRRS